MTELDAPNQQVVRPDASAPWDEGQGGTTHTQPEPKAKKTTAAKASKKKADEDE